MTKLHPVSSLTLLPIIFLLIPPTAHALGSASTLAVISATATVCGIVAAQSTQTITCYQPTTGQIIPIQPAVSFSAISGGYDYLCGLRSGGYAFLCWNALNPLPFSPQRVYVNDAVFLQNLSVGDHQVCATLNDTVNVNNTGTVKCWRDFSKLSVSDKFKSISSGFGFSCGILSRSNNSVHCWGTNVTIATLIQSEFGDMSMLSIEAGGSHVCGVNSNGFLVCRGDNTYGQLNVPNNSELEYSKLALGARHSCAMLRSNGSVV